MFKSILVPIDLADTDLAKPAIATAAPVSKRSRRVMAKSTSQS